MRPRTNNREWIERIVFGSDNSRRFTQDSPVLPDVWITFAEEPKKRKSLIVTPDMDPSGPYEPTTPGALRRALSTGLQAARNRTAPSPWWKTASRKTAPPLDIAHNQCMVLATVWFDELVRVILPMCRWWPRRVSQAGFDDLVSKQDPNMELALARLIENPELSAEAAGLGPKEKKPPPDIVWIIRVVGTIALIHSDRKMKASLLKPEALDLEHYKRVVKAAHELFADLPPSGKDVHIWHVSRNRTTETAIERSRRSVKADAATRVFGVSCKTLAWAVIDSGIDATHPAFRERQADGKPYPNPFEGGNRTRIKATYDFNYVQHLLSSARDSNRKLPTWVQDRLKADKALSRQLRLLRKGLEAGRELDWNELAPFLQVPHADGAYQQPVNEHGTHVAGIMAADWNGEDAADGELGPPEGGLHGIGPDLYLYDLRVLDADGEGEEFNILSALQFVGYLNRRQTFLAIHGVNLSLSLRHDVANFACGHTPICQECERLVAAGAVVVAAAGNHGFHRFMTDKGLQDGYYSISITDPGNADAVITVGSTHRYEPHSYGVSYFSSRGPTGDGRLKPDLVAPGEKIEAPVPNKLYGPKDGTSMAAPHVSGVAALLLARHRELIGQPALVKKVLCETATDLGREHAFQGHGLVDALRALQSI